jgi:hypothetical protein
MWGSIRELMEASPAGAVAVLACAGALVTAPLAMAFMSTQPWFAARRGRVKQRPSFASAVCATLLVMGIPAILLGLLVKSQFFDKNRYEFDPNRTLSVLDEGRRFEAVRLRESLYKADEGIRQERAQLESDRKALANGLTALDQAMLQAAREAGPSAGVLWSRYKTILAGLAPARKWAGVDAPQQLLDFTANPVEMRGVAVPAGGVPSPAPGVLTAAPAEVVAGGGGGLSPEAVAAALGRVPAEQKGLAEMLPLSGLPAGWTVRVQGSDPPLETFHAGNLYEKMDGRAESFLQFGVKGMACASYHPSGDEGLEVQVYVFEMADPFKALGKYGSEKPEEAETIALGDEGYRSGGSVYFHADRYYTIVEVGEDNPKLAEFALEVARRVAAKQGGGGSAGAAAAAVGGNEGGGGGGIRAAATPGELFGLLPAGPGKAAPKYVARDAFGYSFLSDVILADYKEGENGWQGFVRPFERVEEAREVFEKYVQTVKADGGEVKEVADSGAERMAICTNIGLVDVVFLKGNAVGGVNGATSEVGVVGFARKFARDLPGMVPTLPRSGDGGGPGAGEGSGEGAGGEK